MCNALTETVLLFFCCLDPEIHFSCSDCRCIRSTPLLPWMSRTLCFCILSVATGRWIFNFFPPSLWHAMCSRRLFYWQSPLSLRSSCPPTLPKVQWLFPMWNTVGLSIPLARVFKSTFMLILCFSLSQWLTSAWRVAWFVTKTPISSFCVSPGHRKPAATSVEVQRSQRCCL